MLFSYCNFPFDREVYLRNWDYYQARCESSSSLSYSVHAICAADLSLPESSYSYLMKTARLDLDDDHDCAWQGVHTACAAGAWLAVVRGITGVVFRENGLELNPHMIPWWDCVESSVSWRGRKVSFSLTNEVLTVTADESNAGVVPLFTKDGAVEVEPGQQYVLKTALSL